jgi:hypothetical protein
MSASGLSFQSKLTWPFAGIAESPVGALGGRSMGVAEASTLGSLSLPLTSTAETV